MRVEFFSVEFFDSEGHITHNAIMTEWELGEYLIRNRSCGAVTVKVGPQMETVDCLRMSRLERGVGE